MAMDRLDGEFAVYWDGLRAALGARLRPLTLSLFRDLPSSHATAVARLVSDGKKLRGALVLTVCDALGGSIESALPSAVAIECVHAASLIHDDLIDGDRMRRDRPATWVVHGSRRAVLLADVMFATALQRSAERGNQGVITLSRATATLAVGAYEEHLDLCQVDPRGARDTLRHAHYERIIRLKTGSLFAAAAELGAIAARSRLPLRRAASEFGARIGEAYQIADDLNDVLSGPRGACASPQQMAALSALLACFNGSPEPSSRATGGAVDFSDRFLFDAPRVAAAMKTEIERRVELAREALALFPVGPRLALLHRAPRAIVNPMIDAAARSRNGELAVDSRAR
jgi:hypothetical protein